MIKTFMSLLALSFVLSGGAQAQDACDSLKGPEKAACKQAAKQTSDKTNRGRAEEMRGQGAEKGKGLAGDDLTKEAKDKAKEKADKKVKDLKEEAKGNVKNKAKEKAEGMLKTDGD